MSLKAETTIRLSRGSITVKGERNRGHTVLEIEKQVPRPDEPGHSDTEVMTLPIRQDEAKELIAALELLL